MRRTIPMLVSLVLTAAWGLAADTNLATTNDQTRSGVGHTSRAAHVTMRDGTCRDVALEGVGCPVAICSRVAIRSRAAGASLTQTNFDDISALEGINSAEVVLVLKDGSKQRRSVVSDNRVLYVTTADGRKEKIDLGAIESLNLLPPAAKDAR